jgi:hypothetical protein
MLFQIVIAFGAARYVRTHYYWVFRASHLLFPLVLLFSVAHYHDCFYWFQFGMILVSASCTASRTFLL